MSICPKILTQGKDEFTTFHMRITNNSSEAIEGYISYKIVMPDGKIDVKEYNRIERIEANSEVDLFDKYYIEKENLKGRYFVEGRFFWDNQNILSDTSENDFFDIV